eukprot:CAMPEP_0202974858 /NCGR_PEP_ID=MMETSP1396-20130829/64593_1 /ASSEMBLY_ACC=CAM_ASM_000872 /TAXON_ID= /ORGANISM="Pseudokeronopsis sp., Strain Brazil" /LENGTH=130 /DNA_ID=CAMNT_0049709497 /DNA_START=194 /DNA_END=585 /DNA_ORIENTATION=-
MPGEVSPNVQVVVSGRSVEVEPVEDGGLEEEDVVDVHPDEGLVLVGPHVGHRNVVPVLDSLVEQVVDVLDVVVQVHSQKRISAAESEFVGVFGEVVECEDLTQVAIRSEINWIEPEPGLESEHLPNEPLV